MEWVDFEGETGRKTPGTIGGSAWLKKSGLLRYTAALNTTTTSAAIPAGSTDTFFFVLNTASIYVSVWCSDSRV